MNHPYHHAYEGLKHLFTSTILEVASFMILTFGSILTILSEIISTTNVDIGQLPYGIHGVAGVEAGEIILVFGLVLHAVSAVLHLVGLKHASEDHRMFRYGLIFVGISFGSMLLSEGLGFAMTESETAAGILERVETIADILSIFFVCKGIRQITTDVGRMDVATEKLDRQCMILVGLALVEEIIGMILPSTLLWRSMLSLVLRELGYILYMVYIHEGYSALAPSNPAAEEPAAEVAAAEKTADE